jgi:hypothetical protein
MSKIIAVCAALAFCVGLASSAMAVDNKVPAPAVNAGSMKKSVGPSNLTSEECEGAGGKVQSVADCPTGSACFRADQFHVVHVVCLEKK